MNAVKYLSLKKGNLINNFLLLIIITAGFQSCEPFGEESDELSKELNSLEGIEASKFPAPPDYSSAYEIYITQPVDHSNPNGPTFTQRAYLYHQDKENPVVFTPSGTVANDQEGYELTQQFNGNQLMVTHRYYPNARPDELNWEYLTLEQSASDHHRIVEKLKEIYNGPWISAGKRKGGYAALCHKRFYPQDVSAVVAYSTPFYNGIWDLRPNQYFKEISKDECYSRLKEFQVTLMKKKKEVIPYIKDYIAGTEYTYNINKELLYEMAVMDLSFSLWQYKDSYCQYLPDSNATNEELYRNLINSVDIKSFSSDYSGVFEPYAYQHLTEIGTFGYPTEHIAQYMEEIPLGDQNRNPNLELLGPDTPMNYDADINNDIYTWLREEGDNIIYIYGTEDPLQACNIELTEEVNAVKVIQEGANREVNLEDLDKQDMVISTIEEWLGYSID